MLTLPEALAPLGDYNQFILFKLVPRKNKPGKMDKIPVDHRTLKVMESGADWQNDPNAWTDAKTAIALASYMGDDYGVGFLFTVNDPFFFLDIDDCLQVDRTWSPVAMSLLGQLPGAAVEISQSGTGLHIFGKGTAPPHGCRNDGLNLEFYTERRFVALTGNGAMGSANVDCTAALSWVVTNYFPEGTAVATNQEWTTAPVDEWSGPADDDALIKKALASKSVAAKFGNRATFADLWNKNVDVLADMYGPDSNDSGEFDESKADAALAQHLAFWTGKDCERISRLMFRSNLVRDKWSRDDYIPNTITRAVALQTDVYSDNKKSKEPPRVSVNATGQPLGVASGPEYLTGYQFLGVTQQVEHFKGCVYIQDIHKIFTPKGSFLKTEQFNATYGGYVFQLESQTSGKVTRKAWEAFTESQAIRYPKAEASCFRPELTPGELINQDGRILVNTYIEIKTPRQVGDVSPFLNHLRKVLPNERDQSIMLAYMAACIQHKGIKFQWAPLLQGIEGNGKTLFTRCVAFAIGEQYVHMPPATEISEKFNAWLFNTLFIGVEDIYVPEHKSEVIEIIKPMITNDRLAKRDMGVGQKMDDSRCNFMFNSNHKNAIQKTKRDRRFATFYTAQQNPGDIERDGLGGNYFPILYEWLKTGGYAIVNEYLSTYAIPDELNPAGACHRAPQTSTTDQAINDSMGRIEQEIIEAIDEGRPGFAGGWISSMALELLLKEHRATGIIPPNKRREVLQGLGYDWHPGLKDGRVNNITMTDNGKPRLFILNGHISAALQVAADISKAYDAAQTAHIGQTGAAARAFGNH